MKLNIERYSLNIIPEDIKDEVFIEEVLGLKEGGDTIPLRRKDAFGFGSIAYLETVTEK